MVGNQGSQANAQAGVPDQACRRCVLFGCLEVAAWIISDPKAASCPPARSTWTCCSTAHSPGRHRTAASECRSGAHEDDPGWWLRSAQQTSAVDSGRVAVKPSSYRCA